MSEKSERLKAARIEVGYVSAAQAARAIGVPVPTYSHHENGTRDFDQSFAKRYASAFNIPFAKLYIGFDEEIVDGNYTEEYLEASRRATAEKYTNHLPRDNAKTSLKLHRQTRKFGPNVFSKPGPGVMPEIDVQAGAGEGSIGEIVNYTENDQTISAHLVIDYWALPEDYLRTELRASTSNTVILQVVGDSMEPTYRPGDRVVVDLSQKTLNSDTVYLITDGESAPRIKRLVAVLFSKPRRVRVISDNPAIDDQEVDAADLIILGRVVGAFARR